MFHHVECNYVESVQNFVGVCLWVRNKNALSSACLLTFAVESGGENCSTPTSSCFGTAGRTFYTRHPTALRRAQTLVDVMKARRHCSGTNEWWEYPTTQPPFRVGGPARKLLAATAVGGVLKAGR